MRLTARLGPWALLVVLLTNVQVTYAERTVFKDSRAMETALAKLKPPLALPPPPVPGHTYQDVDLREYAGRGLSDEGDKQFEGSHFGDALKLHYWAVQDGYDASDELARDYAALGEADAALYWLQQAAVTEDARLGDTDKDPFYEKVRSDSRWADARAFTDRAFEIWRDSGYREMSLVLPDGYEKDRPIPLIVGLHGNGSNGLDFVDENYQSFANKMQVAIVGISGSWPYGPLSFSWYKDHDRDVGTVNDALQLVSSYVDIAPGKVVLFGFSRGSNVAEQIAVRNPEYFAGALLMSFGTGTTGFSGVTRQSAHESQRFIVTYGEDEFAGYIEHAMGTTRHLEALGASVEIIKYPDRGHRFPPDYNEKWESWIGSILDHGDARN